MREKIIFWLSKKQYIVSTTNIKAKYIAPVHSSKKKLWIRLFLNEIAGGKLLKLC